MNSHPDAETLSAFLDGEAPEAEEHVRTCAECRERLDVLARVRTAVASPPPAYDTARKNAAIAAAVDAAAATPGTTSERRSLWRLVAAVGVAAAVVGGVLAVNRVTTSHTSSTASGPVASDVVRAGNLGDINDDLALRAAVQPSLPSANKGSAGAGPFGADNGASGQVGGAAGKAGPANATPAPSVTALSTTRVTGPRQPPRCEAQARQFDAKGAELTYEATARWQGTPADVFGFSPAGARASPPGRPAPTRVYVLARSDCHLLVFQSYAP